MAKYLENFASDKNYKNNCPGFKVYFSKGGNVWYKEKVRHIDDEKRIGGMSLYRVLSKGFNYCVQKRTKFFELVKEWKDYICNVCSECKHNCLLEK